MKRDNSHQSTICARVPVFGSWTSALALIAAITSSAPSLGAQICSGTPAISNVQFNYDQLAVGNSYGGVGTLVGQKFASGLALTYRNITPNLTGFEGQLRFSGIVGSSRFKVCPGVRLGYARDTWDVRSGLSVTTNLIGLGAGVGVGYEQPIVKGLYLIPYANVGYGFNLTLFNVAATNASTNVTADTVSGLTVEYGVLAHYRFVFAGWAASRAPGTTGTNPSSTRIIVGATFSDRSLRK